MHTGVRFTSRHTGMSTELLNIGGPPGGGRSRPERASWLRVRLAAVPAVAETRALMRRLSLNTVCEEAACPNIGECWAERHATVMILGSVCTRACAFCNVDTGVPEPVDPGEPTRLAEAVDPGRLKPEACRSGHIPGV